MKDKFFVLLVILTWLATYLFNVSGYIWLVIFYVFFMLYLIPYYMSKQREIRNLRNKLGIKTNFNYRCVHLLFPIARAILSIFLLLFLGALVTQGYFLYILFSPYLLLFFLPLVLIPELFFQNRTLDKLKRLHYQ
jgi:hypothetical protein